MNRYTASRWDVMVLATIALLMGWGCRSDRERAAPASENASAAKDDSDTKGGQAEMPTNVATLRVTSEAFEQNQPIPVKHTGDDVDISPAIAWSGAPEWTEEFVLIMDDPDAPRPEPWVHWLIYKIPAGTARLEKNIPTDSKLNDPTGAMQGVNSWDQYGYGGPQPPKGHGVHRYFFKVYALDAPLEVKPGLRKDELLGAMEGHIIGQGELIGTYER